MVDFWEELPERIKKALLEKHPKLAILIKHGLLIPEKDEGGKLILVVNTPLAKHIGVHNELEHLDMKPIDEVEANEEYLRTAAEELRLYTDPRTLKELEEMGIVKISGQVLRVVRLSEEGLLKWASEALPTREEFRRIVEALRRLEDLPPNEAEKLTNSDPDVSAAVNLLRSSRRRKAKPRLRLEDIELLPPKRYRIDELGIPPQLASLGRLYLLGLAILEGRININEVLHLVKEGDHEGLKELINRHVQPSAQSVKSLLETIGFLVGLVRGGSVGGHSSAIARISGRCPRCGKRVKISEEVVCTVCGFRSEADESEPLKVERLPRLILAYKDYSSRYPHLFPIVPVKDGKETKVLVNPEHPLVKALRGRK